MMQNLPISPSASPVVPSQVASPQADAGAQDSTAAASTGGDFNSVLARQLAAESEASVKESKSASVTPAVSSLVVLEAASKVTDKHVSSTTVDNVTTAAQNGMMALMGAPMVTAELKPAATSVSASGDTSSASTQNQQSLLSQLQAGETNGAAGKAIVGQSVVSDGSASNASTTQDMKFSAVMQAAVDQHTAVAGTTAAGLQQAATASDPAKDARLLAQSQAQAQNLVAGSQLATTNVSQNLTVSTPVGSNRWNEDLGQKITWMVGHGYQSAELHLNPPDLGPLNVVLNVSGDQATAMFTSPHAAVRDAVQQALPKLREMLADNGIMLGNAFVSDQGRQGTQSGFSGGGQKSPSPSSSGAIEVSSVQQGTRSASVLQTQGLVDTFA